MFRILQRIVGSVNNIKIINMHDHFSYVWSYLKNWNYFIISQDHISITFLEKVCILKRAHLSKLNFTENTFCDAENIWRWYYKNVDSLFKKIFSSLHSVPCCFSSHLYVALVRIDALLFEKLKIALSVILQIKMDKYKYTISFFMK